jgi:broad specificity phosphatase PhoE
MRFVGLRHGQSTYNLQQLCNDDPLRDVPLTGVGIAQAEAALPRLRHYALSAVYCSPLPRAVQTARIVNQGLRLPLRILDGLADIRSGCDGLPVADYLAAIAHDPLHARVGDGESLLDHFQRVSACLDRLAAQGADWPLLVAHEETLRVFKAWAEGLSLEQVVGLPFDNALPYAFESED